MADDDKLVNQDDIEELLRQAQSGSAPKESAAPPPKPPEEEVALDQGEIEALLAGGSAASAKPVAPAPPPAAPSSQPAAAAPPPQAGGAGQASDVELLLNKAEQALASIDQPSGELPPGVKPFELSDFNGTPPNREAATLELVRDVQLDLRIELGRTRMHLEDVLQLGQGAIVPLDKLAGDPVDVFVNGRLVAQGEVLVLNDNFCVRITELIAGDAAVA